MDNNLKAAWAMGLQRGTPIWTPETGWTEEGIALIPTSPLVGLQRRQQTLEITRWEDDGGRCPEENPE